MTYKIKSLVYNNSISLLKYIESFNLKDSMLLYGISAYNKVLPTIAITNDRTDINWADTPALIYYKEHCSFIDYDACINIISSGATVLPTSETAVHTTDKFPVVVYSNYKNCITKGSFFNIKAVTVVLDSHVKQTGSVIVKLDCIGLDNNDISVSISDTVFGERPNFISLPFDINLIKACKITVYSKYAVLLHDVSIHGDDVPA